jgi:hypothetical protein
MSISAVRPITAKAHGQCHGDAFHGIAPILIEGRVLEAHQPMSSVRLQATETTGEHDKVRRKRKETGHRLRGVRLCPDVPCVTQGFHCRPAQRHILPSFASGQCFAVMVLSLHGISCMKIWGFPAARLLQTFNRFVGWLNSFIASPLSRHWHALITERSWPSDAVGSPQVAIGLVQKYSMPLIWFCRSTNCPE